jgi:hypothetical protein
MADDEPHAVVRLLLKRMESHPEEFRAADEPFHDRWYDHVNSIQAFGSEADKAAMAEGLREIRLAEVHERVMDELVNGPERRRKEEEEREYERQVMQQALQRNNQMSAQQALMQQQQAYVNQLHGMVGQVYDGGGGSGAGIVGKHAAGEYDYDLDRYRNAVPTLYGDYGSATSVLPVANGGTDNTIINQIKNMLKKGK